MKLKLVTIEIGTGIIHCQAAWLVQDVQNTVAFKIPEADLYQKQQSGDRKCFDQIVFVSRFFFGIFFLEFFFCANNLLPFCPCISVTNKSDY
jgi:hypothetical protein